MDTKPNIKIDNLNPTFLFTWKGSRDVDEDSYHCHDHLEIAYIMAGSGKYYIEGEMYDVREGDLLILNPGVKHQAQLTKEGEIPTTEFFVGATDIQFPNYPRNYLPVPKGGHIMHPTVELRRKIARICSAMETENKVSREGRYVMLKAFLIQLILLIFREQCKPSSSSEGYAFESVNKNHVVDKIISYFQDHYSEKISLDHIAENMYLSPFYISKIFKSETGDTPINYLINIRLERAKILLENGDNGSIQEIAAMVGYDDAYHFSKLFKKRYGMSPSEARKRANL